MAERENIPPAASVGERLRLLRTRAMLSQSEMASLARISRGTVQNIESGRTAPQGATLLMVATALRLEPNDTHWLITGEEAPATTPGPAAPDGALDTPFIGRKNHLAAVTAAIADPSVRLLTLTGPGGVGKTRLAIETARAMGLARAPFASVDVIPLANIVRPDDVLPAILAAARLPAAGDILRAGLPAALSGQRRLIVLDNLEHLLPAASDIAWLLRTIPGASVLATSREALRIPGERVMVIEPLSTEGVASPAVELFLRLANQVRPGLDDDDRTRAAVRELCEQLAGLPLAIELAAAQMDVLDPGDLLVLMRDAGLRALAPALTDEMHRFSTMDDAIAWSANRLGPDDQRLWRSLSVFSGGFRPDAAAAVAAAAFPDAPMDRGMVAASLTRLARVHLIQRRPAADHDDGVRFSQLEPIRLKALADLSAAGEAHAVRRAHAEWALAYAARIAPGVSGEDGAEALDRMERDYPNLRVALDWAIAEGDGELVGNLILAIFPFWLYRDHSDDALRRLERAQATVPTIPLDSLGFLSFAGAEIAFRQGNQELVRRCALQLLELGERLGSHFAIAGAKLYLSLVAPDEPDRATALALIEEARAALGPDLDWDPPFIQGWAALRLGVERHRVGDLEGARAALERATALRHHAVGRSAMPGSGGHLGLVLDDLGEPRAAAAAIASDIDAALRLGDRWTAVRLGWWLLLTLLPHAADPDLGVACAGLLAALATNRERHDYAPTETEGARLEAAMAGTPLPHPPHVTPSLAGAVAQASAMISRLPEHVPSRPGARLVLPSLA